MKTIETPQKQEVTEVEKVVEEIIELLVPPSDRPAQLFKFLCKFSNEFEYQKKSRKYGEIMHMYGGWKQGVAITMAIWPADYDKFMEKIGNLATVRRIDEVQPNNPFNYLCELEKPEALANCLQSGKRIVLALDEFANTPQVFEPMLVAV